MVGTLLIPLPGRLRQGDLRVRGPAWFIARAPGQSGPHRKTLSQKQKNTPPKKLKPRNREQWRTYSRWDSQRRDPRLRANWAPWLQESSQGRGCVRKLAERGSRLLPATTAVTRDAHWDSGDVGWGVSVVPRCDSPQQGQKSSPGEGAVAWAGRRQASRNLGGKASTEVGRRSLRPSQVRRRGRRERRARVCRQGEAHPPQRPMQYLFPENMGPRIT